MAYKNKMLRNPVTGQHIRFLQTAADTGGELLELETVYQAASKQPVPHYHPFQEEWFTVLEGRLTVRIDGQVRQLKAGDTLHIAKNQVHAMWNDSKHKARVNWQVRPALNTEAFMELGWGLAQDGKVNDRGMPPLLQVALMANRYSNVYRLSKPPYAVQKVLFFLLTPFAYLKGYRPQYKKYLN